MASTLGFFDGPDCPSALGRLLAGRLASARASPSSSCLPLAEDAAERAALHDSYATESGVLPSWVVAAREALSPNRCLHVSHFLQLMYLNRNRVEARASSAARRGFRSLRKLAEILESWLGARRFFLGFLL